SDLDSTNGTMLGPSVLLKRALALGRVDLGLGKTLLRFTPLEEEQEIPLSRADRFGSVVGRSPAMRELFEQLERIAASDSTVLLEGETGTGKELIAEAIHQKSSRAAGPFVVVDCGAIPRTLIESELFGHVRG